MPPTILSQSNTLSLDEVTARLAAKDVVDGLLTIGSRNRNELTPASDYDLIVILREVPVPLHVALTYIDHRITDIIFVSVAEIARLLQNDRSPIAASWDQAQLIQWLRTGQIVFDRSGQIKRAQNRVSEQPEKKAIENEVYSAWFSINYNLKHIRRLLVSDDPAYRMAVDLRLLFSLHDLWRFYFLLRDLPPQGEKAQFRYLSAHDPVYLERFQQCLAESNRKQKVLLYEKLAQLTLAPVGALWEDNETAILPEPGANWKANTVQDALALWETLVS